MNYKRFSDINLMDTFFDSLKLDYKEFEEWYLKKSANGDKAYVVNTTNGIQGFLYLKVEDDEINDIIPLLNKAKRVKVGTLKVNPHGTRLGERFIKKIFDYAITNDVQEIYVTVFSKHIGLITLLEKYGFDKYGKKITGNGDEEVFVKKLREQKTAINENYPLIELNGRSKYILSIKPEFHSRLFPDSILNSENYDVIQDVSHTNSIHKIYICFMDVSALKPGDSIIIYRTSDGVGPAHYRSVVTSVCTVEEVKSKSNFLNVDDYLRYCKDYSVFEESELRSYFTKSHMYVIKMTYNAAFSRRITRGKLIEDVGVNSDYWGFFKLTGEHFVEILKTGGISESIIIN